MFDRIPRPTLLKSRRPAPLPNRPLLPELERYLQCDQRDPLIRLEAMVAELTQGLRTAEWDVTLLVQTGLTGALDRA